MKLYIVTGTSSGIGKALISRLKSHFESSTEDHFIIHGSRSTIFCETLFSNSHNNQLKEVQIPFDLSSHESCRLLFSKLETTWKSLADFKMDSTNQVILIQNAGVLQPISLLYNANLDDWQSNLEINTLGPARILQHILKLQIKHPLPLLGVHISSGAAAKGYPGWSAYCASKAGLEKMVESVAMECHHLGLDSKLVSLAPGVIDTPMQEQIRSAKPQDFPSQQRFVELFENDELWSADFVAQHILSWIDRSNRIENGKRYDLRELLD
jgi:benzil reductase ((S)-benzoin forming)